MFATLNIIYFQGYKPYDTYQYEIVVGYCKEKFNSLYIVRFYHGLWTA